MHRGLGGVIVRTAPSKGRRCVGGGGGGGRVHFQLNVCGLHNVP